VGSDADRTLRCSTSFRSHAASRSAERDCSDLSPLLRASPWLGSPYNTRPEDRSASACPTPLRALPRRPHHQLDLWVALGLDPKYRQGFKRPGHVRRVGSHRPRGDCGGSRAEAHSRFRAPLLSTRSGCSRSRRPPDRSSSIARLAPAAVGSSASHRSRAASRDCSSCVRAPPNKALQLTANSWAQSRHGSILTSGVPAVAPGGLRCWRHLSAQSVGRREAVSSPRTRPAASCPLVPHRGRARRKSTDDLRDPRPRRCGRPRTYPPVRR
jgi:hypothetical protein